MFKKENRTTIIFVLVFLLMAGLAIMGAVSSTKGNSSSTNTSDGQPIIGNPEAPVKIQLFVDYKCSHCYEWENSVYPKLKKDYVDTGIASIKVMNYVIINEYSLLAALAAEHVFATNPEAFAPFHEELYKHFNENFSSEGLAKIAKNFISNLNEKEFVQSISSQKYMDNLLKDRELVKKYNLTGTPSLIINEKDVKEEQNYEEIKKLIEEAK